MRLEGRHDGVQRRVASGADGVQRLAEARDEVAAEVAAASAGDEICVEISIPYAEVTWVATPEYLAGKNLSGRCVMRRE